jgi:hypothetical protein
MPVSRELPPSAMSRRGRARIDVSSGHVGAVTEVDASEGRQVGGDGSRQVRRGPRRSPPVRATTKRKTGSHRGHTLPRENKNPRFAGSFRADDGTRTHDLLHGKCGPRALTCARVRSTRTVEQSAVRQSHLGAREFTPSVANVATWPFRACPVRESWQERLQVATHPATSELEAVGIKRFPGRAAAATGGHPQQRRISAAKTRGLRSRWRGPIAKRWEGPSSVA